MKPLFARRALLAAFVLVVGAALFAVHGNERTLQDGRIVLVRLAPVDPRSLMQGDYMALRYTIDNELPGSRRGTTDRERPPAYAWLAVDAQGRASLIGSGNALPTDPALVGVKIRRRDGRATIGPNAFFFQEGRADAFAGAQWGEFRVDADGKALLTHLRDEHLQRMGEIRR